MTGLHVAVCIATYKRPTGLGHLLDGLAEQEWAGPLTVIVVDNDAEGREGLGVCEGREQSFPWPLISAVEPRAGIPFPRNLAIEIALGHGADLLAFIDDDERPKPTWISHLCAAIEAGADLAGGPQLPVFPPTATPEQRRTEYYGHDQALTRGATCQLESSGNFIATASILRPLGPPWFDPTYAQTSGADHNLFRQLEQAGAVMRWVPDAAVFEDIPEHRLQREWLRERVIEIHNGRVRIDSEYHKTAKQRFVRTAKTVGLGAWAMMVTIAGVARPSIRHEAALLRWKFLGKARAHVGSVIHRVEDRPAEQ